MAKKHRFTKPPKPASRKTEQLVPDCLEKAPEEAEQEDVHVPKERKGSSRKTKQLVTGCVDKAPEEAEQEDVHVQTDTHITGLQAGIDDVPLDEWFEKCNAGQQATKDDDDVEIDEVAADALLEQFIAKYPNVV
jgi:hypothetical protein